MESKANGANEPIYKTETDPQTSKTSLWLPVRRGLEEGQDRAMGLRGTNCYA